MDGNGYVKDTQGIEHCVMNHFGNGSDVGCLELKQLNDRMERTQAQTQPAAQPGEADGGVSADYLRPLFEKSQEEKRNEETTPFQVYRPYGFFP
jgi:hypothetical protein